MIGFRGGGIKCKPRLLALVLFVILVSAVAEGMKEATVDAQTGSAAADDDDDEAFWDQFRVKPKIPNAADSDASEAPPRISPIPDEHLPYEQGGLLVMNDETGRRVSMKKQRNDGNEVEVKGTRGVIDESVSYLRNTILTDGAYSEIHTKCENKHELCSFWAFNKQCESNQNYMIRDHYCLLACKRCDKLLDSSS